MLARARLLSLALSLAAVGSVATAGHAGPLGAARGAAAAAETPSPMVARLAPRLDSDPATFSACAAPSVVKLHAADDSMDATVPGCGVGDAWSAVPYREQGESVRCDAAGRPGLLAHVLSGALPLDAVTAAHVHTVFQSGLRQGRRTDAFGLVGDSMTAAGTFLRPFATPHPIPRPVARTLSLADGTPVVDFFRDAKPRDPGQWADSFLAPRAAKVGVIASWPLRVQGESGQTPLEAMIDAVSPAYAVILYGANDALSRTDSSPDVQGRLRGDYTGALAAIVDLLETRGIVPILTTVPKHMREAGWPDCPPGEAGGANERFAAQATTLSAAVADLACLRHLPLIDLRWSLDPLVNHGVGPDGVHLSVHPGGGAVLDDTGVQCGTNVRNLVTLRELGRVVDAATAGVW